MKSENRTSQEAALKDVTPATAVIAILFAISIVYFVLDEYFIAEEYYIGAPPYGMLVTFGIAGALVVRMLLTRIEPARNNSAAYALLAGLGVGFASYSSIAHINILTDSSGLHAYQYTLSSRYVWEPNDPSIPPNTHVP